MTLLEPRELELIRESWSLVVPKMKDHAVNYYISMFINYPEWRINFFQYIDPAATLEELQTSPVLAAHASQVFYSVHNLVLNLESTDIVVEGLKKIARVHWPLNIKGPELKAGIKLLYDYLEAALDGYKNLTDALLAWAKIGDIMYMVLAEEQSKIEDQGGHKIGKHKLKPEFSTGTPKEYDLSEKHKISLIFDKADNDSMITESYCTSDCTLM